MSGADPFLIQGPARISFSGGRTSAYMLWRIIQAHGGELPDDVHVCFANTGKEREETLRFVYECSARWGVKVRWLEFLSDLKSVGPQGRYEEVGFNSASRNGEPLDRLIERKKALFSTSLGRWCTGFCKIQPLNDFMSVLGYVQGAYSEVIGFRADERDRIAELPYRKGNENSVFAFPLAKAGVRKVDVLSFWATQPFDLELAPGTGNCDHCPFLGEETRIARCRLNPSGLDWWKERESRFDFSFGRSMSMAAIEDHIARTPLLPFEQVIVPDEEPDAECFGWCAPTEIARHRANTLTALRARSAGEGGT